MLYFTTLARSLRCTVSYKNRFGGISPLRFFGEISSNGCRPPVTAGVIMDVIIYSQFHINQ